MPFRKIIFWLHLVAGVVAGGVILVMCLTGAALAFEKEIIAWAERDLRRIAPSGERTVRLPTEDLLDRVRRKHPEVRPTGITLYSDPDAALLVSAGRTNACYVNPHTGEVRTGSGGVRRFMQGMIEWHRWLGTGGDNRSRGKAITGACNAAFLALAVTGIYLWWPRYWSGAALRRIAILNFKLRGKARDWNWHNTVGIWSAPVLIVLTATALPISYRWAGDLIYTITRSTPAEAGGGGGGGMATGMPQVPAGSAALRYDELFDLAGRRVPGWEQMTLRLGESPRRSAEAEGGKGLERRGPKPVSISIRGGGSGPGFAATQVVLDPVTGSILREERYADFNRGRKVRSWTRFLHTGEALGPGGQLVAGLASLGGGVLVWTGFALALRRFFGGRMKIPAADKRESAPVREPWAPIGKNGP